MRVYFVACDEYTFLTTFQAEHFPPFFSAPQLMPQDTLLFSVKQEIAGMGVVDANGQNIHITHIFQPAQRLAFVGPIRSLLVNEWGVDITTPIEQHVVLSPETAESLIQYVRKTPTDTAFYLTDVEYLLEDEAFLWEQSKKEQQKQQVKEKETRLLAPIDEPIPTTDHAKAQFYLKEIAKITNCSVWTANNDKNRLYKGKKLGEDDKEHFPSFELDEEVKKRIQLIDTIWFQGDFPVSCFEVETSTSVYSGLLRMSDMVAVMPSRGVKCYIVAPNARKKKVMQEMNRPVFRAIGLPHIARFISIESLEILYQKIKGLDGYIHPHVIEAISLCVEEMEVSESF